MKKIISSLLITAITITVFASCKKMEINEIPIIPATIDSPAVSIALDPTFGTVTNVLGGSSNVTIAKWKITAIGESQKISSINIVPSITNTTPLDSSLSNVSIYYNGYQIGTFQNFTGNSLVFNLGNQLIVSPDNPGTLEVHSDIRNSSGFNNYTSGNISVTGFIPINSVQGVSNGKLNKIAVNLPKSNLLNIIGNGLAITKNTGYANQVFNSNTTNVKIGSYFIFNQSSTEATRISQLNIPIAGSFSLASIKNFRTSEISGNGNIGINPGVSNNFSVDFILNPGSSRMIDIFADLESSTGTIITSTKISGIWTSSNIFETSSLIIGQTVTVN